MIAIVSHDAGGAEVLSSWASHQNESYCLVVDGPAISIFQKKVGDQLIVSLEQAIQQCDWVLCGTSWQSDLERRAIRMCKLSGKRVISFIDHWVNYRERFLINNKLILPDEIWVGDEVAEEIARNIFPSTRVVLKANPYVEDLLHQLENITHPVNVDAQMSILYICEPIREHAMLQHGDECFWGYTEEDALIFFLKKIEFLGQTFNQIKIRPHPSEKIDKYDWAKDFPAPIVISDGTHTLIEEISAAGTIVGCESMAMVIGLFANKRVLSCIPPGGKTCSLPQAGIEHLQTIVSQYSRLGHAI